MTLLALIRLYLRRYRLLFATLLVLVFLHETVFLFLFQLWKKNVQLSDFVLSIMPARVRTGMNIPIHDLADPKTFKALVYLRPDSRLLTLLFGVTVGTDVLAGEIGRGTGELLFSHPVRRTTAVLAGVATVFLHLVCVGAVTLVGFKVGARIFPMGPAEPTLPELIPATAMIVIGSLVISLTAFLFGSLCASRGKAVGLSLLFILGPGVLEFMGLFTSLLTGVARLFPEHYYRPHSILVGMEHPSFLDCTLALLAIGVVALAGSLFFAARRDLT